VSRVISPEAKILAMPRRLLGPLYRRVRTLQLPFGRAASDRRLLKQERASLGDHIAVVGSPLATLQAVTHAQIDIVGSNPFDRRVTVLSDALGAGSLPTNRWQAVIFVDPPLEARSSMLEAASSACRKDGAVVVLADRSESQLLTHRVHGRRQLVKMPNS
jgi:hypothetical protein